MNEKQFKEEVLNHWPEPPYPWEFKTHSDGRFFATTNDGFSVGWSPRREGNEPWRFYFRLPNHQQLHALGSTLSVAKKKIRELAVPIIEELLGDNA
jgi:hypothetical protein